MKIAITGVGILCAIGHNAEEVEEALRSRMSGIGTMRYLASPHHEFPVGEVKLSDEEMRRRLGLSAIYPASRTTLLGALALRQALDDAKPRLEGQRVVVLSGTTVGGMDFTEHYVEAMQDTTSTACLAARDSSTSTREMARLAGVPSTAETATLSTACSSSLNALIVGSELLRSGEADLVIAGGTEALSLFHFNGFRSLLILDHERCRPFDATRAGLNLGEGAAFVVMQSADALTAAPYGYIRGYGNRCDAFHQTATSESGDGPYLAMTEALRMAHLTAADVAYVHAHGTGTPNNDASESAALRRVFGEKRPWVSSTKAYTGHTTSAAGALSVVISLLAMRHGFVPANLGWHTPDAACLTPSCGEEGVTLRHTMCNAFGFGGNDSSLILSQQPCSLPPLPDAMDVEVAAEVTLDDEALLSQIRQYLTPLEARRMGRLLKAATLTSLQALQAAGLDAPEAIVSATALGMSGITEQYLQARRSDGEATMSPTAFMQSTHNTLAASIAIRLHCHGYNLTYSHGAQSFSWAMREAQRLIRTGQARTVLVGCHDEATPLYQAYCARQGLTPPPAIYSKSLVLRAKP